MGDKGIAANHGGQGDTHTSVCLMLSLNVLSSVKDVKPGWVFHVK